MKNLIEALTIFLKYQDLPFPTHCEHDVMTVVGITKEEVSEEDQKRLAELGFFWTNSNGGGWYSYTFGSA